MIRSTLAIAFSLLALSVNAAEERRNATGFNAIDIRGPISLEVQVGKPHSVTVVGGDKYIGLVTTEVVNGELRLDMRRRNNIDINDKERVIVTVPELRRFSAEGAGLSELHNVHGERLDVDYKGAGKLHIDGKVRQLRMKAMGVGEVDTRALHTQDADVTFEGLGSVKVHASHRLDATVRGMGELTYYGQPRVLNKSVAGIGSVRAGD